MMKSVDGWIDFSVGFRTESGSVAQAIRFANGHVSVASRIPADVSTTVIYQDETVLRESLSLPPNEVLIQMMKGKMRAEGNLGCLSLFHFYLSLVLGKWHERLLSRAKRVAASGQPTRLGAKPSLPAARGGERLGADPYLSRYSLEDFPRLAALRAAHFDTVPEVCPERPLLLTRWFRENGFERDKSGEPWNPVLRQAHAFKFLMEHRRPMIRENDLIGGTTTSKDVGVVLYPDAHGVLLWGELYSIGDRPLNPCRVSKETARLLADQVFPFWLHRTFREWVREKYHAPLCQRLDERFAVYFIWKTVAVSHTIPDFPKILRLGARGIMAEIDEKLARVAHGGGEALRAMRLCLEGLVAYARNVASKARREAERAPEHAKGSARRAELLRMAETCERVPEHPAATLDEALQSIWITWVGMHLENTNAGLSLGRLDQWLFPYFEADISRLTGEAEREAYIRKALELIGCFYLRCNDHVPLIPDIGNYLFGGSSANQAITLGGVTREGEDAVNDLTYVFLKVTEMLRLRDPNVNARFSHEKNSDAYLDRLCEVNLLTTASPSIHGDENVIRSQARLGYSTEDVRDWSATGCVEPTISGKHMGHTGSMMFNMVAALEMALHDGYHPLMRWKVGPQVGPARGAFANFEEFFDAYRVQLEFLIDQAVAYNRMLGEAHSVLRPTPFLSALMDGTITSGRDVTSGGARYNTSGVACIGLSDVVDSLMVVSQLVFREGVITLGELRNALAADFVGHEKLHARIMKRVPKFGSGSEEALAMAQRVVKLINTCFAAHRNFRGGRYTTGFWSMSNHVAFGSLTGALPSGRRAGKAFTPGLTPSPQATKNLLDNLRDVASLDPEHMDNNIAFNIKFVPSAGESRAQAVSHMRSYARTYFEMGGMQMQLNVVSSETLRDAMAHPENYRDLLVRISGYNAYFVTLNRDMQIELIERAEYG
ncbi:MAG: formate acetyltransferase [Deltaproteobacteria bacterium]|nr:formate acetyltransferase [Deltaproteobacteria bacterium]